jgi:hypothetical protein
MKSSRAIRERVMTSLVSIDVASLVRGVLMCLIHLSCNE